MTNINPILLKQQARWYPLKAHPVQIELKHAIENGVRFPIVPAGRRCLAKGTLVATPNGGVPIEDLEIGDTVIGYEDGEPRLSTVVNKFDNGVQHVKGLYSRNYRYLQATPNHKLWGCNEDRLDQYGRIHVRDITKRIRIKRVYSDSLIMGGNKSIPNTYALGAILGDGCATNGFLRKDGTIKDIDISSIDQTIPKRIADDFGVSYRKCHDNNYNWRIDIDPMNNVPFFKEWAFNRKSHQKIADWCEIDKWDKETALSFLAGLIDTDGSIYTNKEGNRLNVGFGMQSRSIVECARDIIFKFFQERLEIYTDKRDKYVNGSVYYFNSSQNCLSKRIITALNPFLSKKVGLDLSNFKDWNVRDDRIGLKVTGDGFVQTYDITVGNSTNLYCLHDGGIVTSNSGKTERFKRFIATEAMTHEGGKYFMAAPTNQQAKKIFWDDMLDLTLSAAHRKNPNLTDRIIYLPTGSEIHILGLDNPKRFEGIPWTGGGIDEVADVKSEAFGANIFPALDTEDPRYPNRKAWCWLLGVPDGLNHYYDFAQAALTGKMPDAKVYHWKSSEILSPDRIAAAKQRMSRKQYLQEYEASFETAGGKIYEDYSDENYTGSEILPHEVLHWSHDQNYTPLSSCIAVVRGNDVYFLDEIVLESAVSRQSALEFVEKFKRHENKTVYVYGDPAGRAGEKHGHKSDYTEIEGVLREYGWKFERRVKPAHPSIKDRQNAVRAKIKNAAGHVSLYINPVKAEWCHKAMATCQLKNGSSFQEDETNRYQHISTAMGYFIDKLYPVGQSAKKSQILSGHY